MTLIMRGSRRRRPLRHYGQRTGRRRPGSRASARSRRLYSDRGSCGWTHVDSPMRRTSFIHLLSWPGGRAGAWDIHRAAQERIRGRCQCHERSLVAHRAVLNLQLAGPACGARCGDVWSAAGGRGRSSEGKRSFGLAPGTYPGFLGCSHRVLHRSLRQLKKRSLSMASGVPITCEPDWRVIFSNL